MNTRLYIFDELESFSETHLEAAMQRVSAARKEKTLAYVPVLNRKLSVIAELLLRYAWRQIKGTKPFPAIETASGGKPYFSGAQPLHFNLSHCKTAVACALADTPVGVDVESHRSYHDSLIKKVLNEEEQKSVLDNPARFTELWTLKESYVKYTGRGLKDDLPDLLNRAHDVFFKTFTSEKAYACSVCSGGSLDDLEAVYVSLEELFV